MIKGQGAQADIILKCLAHDDNADSGLVKSCLGPVMERFLKETLTAETVITFAFRVGQDNNVCSILG